MDSVGSAHLHELTTATSSHHQPQDEDEDDHHHQQLVSKDMRASSLDSTAYLSPATAVLAAAAAAAAEANGSHEDHRSLEDPVDHSDAHTSFLTYDQVGTHPDMFSNSSASQMAAAAVAAAYPYTFYTAAAASNIYDVGNTYTSLNNIPITSALVNSTTSGSQSHIQHLTGNGSTNSQLVSYNGSTYIIQPTSVDHLLNGCRSDSPDGQDNVMSGHQMDCDDGHQQPAQNHGQNLSQDMSSIQSPGLQSYITRVSPATIQWLLQNYETAEGVSLPRSTLYSHYLRHCDESKQDPVNAASFGKLIRSVFLGLRTRRIGTRGNSKYHYYGIRLKANSLLNQISESEPQLQQQQQQQQQVQENKQNGVAKKRNANQNVLKSSTNNQELSNNDLLSTSQVKQFFGPTSADVPGFPQLMVTKESLSNPHLEEDTFKEFEDIYKDHCCQILDAVTSLNFTSIEKVWSEFWSGQSSTRTETDEANDDETCMDNIDLKLSPEAWNALIRLPNVHVYVQEADYAFYQHLVDVLLPDVLLAIPNSLTQAIRNFAKNLEIWMMPAVENLPTELKVIKLNSVKSLSQTLRRYTGLNHLAQAARAVLQNSSQISQMLNDLNRVDFGNVQEQASWVCQCDANMVQKLEGEFKATLQEQADLETWAGWLQSVVDKALKPYENKPDFTKAARQFLLRWSFYSSMVIRDLTLRSAASFGSFHLIRLLYDEYMFYLIEHRVAKSLGQTPVAVMGLGRAKCSPQQQQITAINQGDDKLVSLKSQGTLNNNNNNNSSKVLMVKQDKVNDENKSGQREDLNTDPKRIKLSS